MNFRLSNQQTSPDTSCTGRIRFLIELSEVSGHKQIRWSTRKWASIAPVSRSNKEWLDYARVEWEKAAFRRHFPPDAIVCIIKLAESSHTRLTPLQPRARYGTTSQSDPTARSARSALSSSSPPTALLPFWPTSGATIPGHGNASGTSIPPGGPLRPRPGSDIRRTWWTRPPTSFW